MSQNVLAGFYGQPYSQPDHGREIEQYLQQDMMPEGPHEMDQTMTGEGQTLDQIISQNDRELQRRRSTYRQFPTNGGPPAHNRTSSLMDYEHPKAPEGADFQFDSAAPNAVPTHLANAEHTQKGPDRRVRSRENLALDTRFGQAAPGFTSMPNYSQSMVTSTPLDLDPTSHYIGHGMDIPLDYEGPGGDRTPMNLQSGMDQPNFFSTSPEQQTFSPMFQLGQDSPAGPGQAMEQSLMEKVSRMQMPDTIQGMNVLQTSTSSPSQAMVQSGGTMTSPQHIQAGAAAVSGLGIRGQFTGNVHSTSPQGPEMGPAKPPHKFSGIYSHSGFDMLGVLTRVASRPKPEINIGPVDLSCAFVVCDIDVQDMPIVYCSDIFERFTGYSNTDILGKNCRFLQAPDGRVQPGVRRKYVDDRSVHDLKCKISRREEIQMGLVNYRKGGQPFVNLLTMIPVAWDGPKFRYYVGFQVDVVEQPHSVAGRNSDGTYAINYQRRGQFPPYVLKPPERSGMPSEMGQTISRDEVTAVLSTIGSGESELSKRIWDKVLLENSDDVVHVLSLKGLFLYLSPASRKVLEYDASELVGTALSSVCHPSDIVPVTRELKDTSSGAPVNVVFRIRRKHSGYTWFESHGCLHTEQGKGRKCIIMVGRERPVYAINRTEVTTGGGIGDNELWSKMSTSGLFLFVASNSRLLLDRSPMELVGTSIQAMMRSESKKEFGRVLEQARKGRKATTFRHEMQNRRGQVLQAQTTIYPGDAEEGSKPTFLVAQTRFNKTTRSATLSSRPSIAASPRTDQASVGSVTPSASVSGSTGPPRSSATPQSAQSQVSQASQATSQPSSWEASAMTPQPGPGLAIGNQDEALASEDNIFDELKTTRSTSWQFELRQMEKQNRILIEELQGLLSRRKKRKRRKGFQLEKDCANCHTHVTPEWRRGPSGKRDLCNSCGLRWAKQNGRVSPRKPAGADSDKGTASSPQHRSPPDNTFSGGGKTPQSGSTPGKSMSKLEVASSGRGSRPPKIEEGVESQ